MEQSREDQITYTLELTKEELEQLYNCFSDYPHHFILFNIVSKLKKLRESQ